MRRALRARLIALVLAAAVQTPSLIAQSSPLGVWLDGSEGVVGETFLVDGWAAGCGVTIAEAYVGIDYYPAQVGCAVPEASGFAGLLSASQTTPGWHTVALLVRDSADRWAWSNAR